MADRFQALIPLIFGFGAIETLNIDEALDRVLQIPDEPSGQRHGQPAANPASAGSRGGMVAQSAVLEWFILLLKSVDITMDLTELIAQFEGQQPGTDAYKEIKDVCLSLTAKDPPNATAYYLIANFARSYVLLYEEEAVTFEIAYKAKAQMLDYLKRIHSVLQNVSAEARLSTLNAITLDYLKSDRIF